MWYLEAYFKGDGHMPLVLTALSRSGHLNKRIILQVYWEVTNPEAVRQSREPHQPVTAVSEVFGTHSKVMERICLDGFGQDDRVCRGGGSHRQERWPCV